MELKGLDTKELQEEINDLNEKYKNIKKIKKKINMKTPNGQFNNIKQKKEKMVNIIILKHQTEKIKLLQT